LEKLFATKQDLILVIEKEAKLKIDSFVEGAISMAEEVHSGVKREEELNEKTAYLHFLKPISGL